MCDDRDTHTYKEKHTYEVREVTQWWQKARKSRRLGIPCRDDPTERGKKPIIST